MKSPGTHFFTLKVPQSTYEKPKDVEVLDDKRDKIRQQSEVNKISLIFNILTRLLYYIELYSIRSETLCTT